MASMLQRTKLANYLMYKHIEIILPILAGTTYYDDLCSIYDSPKNRRIYAQGHAAQIEEWLQVVDERGWDYVKMALDMVAVHPEVVQLLRGDFLESIVNGDQAGI